MSASNSKYSVYPSPTKGIKECLIVPRGRMIGDVNDADVVNQFRHAELWKTIELNPSKNHAGLDAEQALHDIAANGFHVTEAAINIIESWDGDPGDGEY